MRTGVLLVVALLGSCTLLYPIDELVDTPPDAGNEENSNDSGTPDASEPDDGGVDAGAPDAGGPDGGSVDAGESPTLEGCTADGWCRQKFTVKDRVGNTIAQRAWDAVTGLSKDDVWVTGQNSTVMHWNGTSWLVEHQSVGSMNAIAIASDGRGFAVGRDGAGHPRIIERAANGTWSVNTLPTSATATELRSVGVGLNAASLLGWAVSGSDELWTYASGTWTVSTLPGGRTSGALLALPDQRLFGSTLVPFTLGDSEIAIDESTTRTPFALAYDGLQGVFGVTTTLVLMRSGTVNLRAQSWSEHTFPIEPPTTADELCARPTELLVPVTERPSGGASRYAVARIVVPSFAQNIEEIPAIDVLGGCYVAPTGEAWIVGYTGFQPPEGDVLFHAAD